MPCHGLSHYFHDYNQLSISNSRKLLLLLHHETLIYLSIISIFDVFLILHLAYSDTNGQPCSNGQNVNSLLEIMMTSYISLFIIGMTIESYLLGRGRKFNI